MSNYTPRTSAPEKDNKNYIHTSAGGFNRCLHLGNGQVLPNCVPYSWGRWRELLGYDPKLSRRNAEDWYGYTDDGKKIVGFDENDNPIIDENYVAGEASAEDAAKKAAYEKFLKDILN